MPEKNGVSMRCKDCRFSFPTTLLFHNTVRCKRFPPTAVPIGEKGNLAEAFWPICHDTDYCYEFKPKN